jgi:DNA-binding transcriptional MerR regulator
MGVVRASEISPSGRRLFDDGSIIKIKLVKELNDSGYPLRAIRELFVEGRGKSKGVSP